MTRKRLKYERASLQSAQSASASFEMILRDGIVGRTWSRTWRDSQSANSDTGFLAIGN